VIIDNKSFHSELLSTDRAGAKLNKYTLFTS